MSDRASINGEHSFKFDSSVKDTSSKRNGESNFGSSLFSSLYKGIE